MGWLVTSAKVLLVNAMNVLLTLFPLNIARSWSVLNRTWPPPKRKRLPSKPSRPRVWKNSKISSVKKWKHCRITSELRRRNSLRKLIELRYDCVFLEFAYSAYCRVNKCHVRQIFVQFPKSFRFLLSNQKTVRALRELPRLLVTIRVRHIT